MTLTPLPFPAEIVDALPPGGEGVAERRRRASQALTETPWPTAQAEEWRYSPIAKVDAAAFAPATVAGDIVSSPLCAAIDASARVSIVDGFLASSSDADGVTIGEATADELGALPSDAWGLLAAALAPQPVRVRVSPGTVVDAPVVISVGLSGSGAAFPHLIVEAGVDSEVTVVVVHESADVTALVVPRLEVRAASSARVHVVELQRLGSEVTTLGRTIASIGSQATLTGWTAGLGGNYARHRLDCRLVGRGASLDYSGVYFGSGTQSLDYRVFVDHVERDTTSNLRFNGAVDDESLAIYTGNIHIHPGARGTNATQTNRNITLSPDAWAESVPNLEIENNDVHCAHASTVGPVDEEQLFYLESRGVPTAVARELIVAGFFEQVMGIAPVASVASVARDEIARRLEMRTGR